MYSKTCIIITGPTAAGKTEISIKLARHFTTSIISADSRQCFRELNIGVAKPAAEALRSIKHYFINSHSVTEEVNAAVFMDYALNAVNEIFEEHDVAIIAGGTGLYINAFCYGLDEIPEVPASIRNSIISQYNEKGLPWLQSEIKQKDPEFFKIGEFENPQRMMRALEVIISSGQSILSFRKKNKPERQFNIIKTGIEISRPELYERINLRVDQMMQAGLLDEVKSLLPYKHLNAMQTVGYSELFDFLDGKMPLEKAVAVIKQNTRQYAKRQLTWFKKDLSIKWFDHSSKQFYLNLVKFCK